MAGDSLENMRAWFVNEGPDFDIVLSTRCRISCNLRDYPFAGHLHFTEKKEVFEAVTNFFAAAEDLKKFNLYFLDDMTNQQKGILQERRFVSSRIYSTSACGCFINPDQDLALTTCDEDHVKIASFRNGFNVDACYKDCSSLFSRLDETYRFVRDDQGHLLTSRITDYGTGMKISVLVQLAGLAGTEQLDIVLKEIMQRGISVKGFFNNNLEPIGDLYQISNDVGYSVSSAEIIENFKDTVTSLTEREREVRSRIINSDRPKVGNRVFRAYGLIRCSQKLEAQEALELLAALRFGFANELIMGIPVRLFNALFILSQNNHIKALYLNDRRISDENFINGKRADFIRDMLERYSTQ